MLAARVLRRGADDCWPFLGWCDRDGYGRFEIDGRRYGAHKLALELHVGRQLRPGEVAMHLCDNPPCCNPRHLAAGTRRDNNGDMTTKGRRSNGEDHPAARLTESFVLEIRERYAKGEAAVALAPEFGVSDRMIGLVARGEKWAHVGGPRSKRRHPRGQTAAPPRHPRGAAR